MITPEALAITYGLSSALTWGAGDFSGGYATKKEQVMTVILFSQIIGGVFLGGLQFIFHEPVPGGGFWIWAALAGFCGAFGLAALYQGLASGRMGIVAPVSAVMTALVPVVFAFVTEGPPRPTQILGFGGAMVAVWLFSAGEGASRIVKAELALSVAAGTGFGLFFICIDQAGSDAVLWPLAAARLTSIILITGVLAARGQLTLPGRNQVPCIALAGILDTAGNAFFVLACQVGRLDISAILTSLYPAATVMLARCVLKEHLRPKQWAGLFAALGALVLIAS